MKKLILTLGFLSAVMSVPVQANMICNILITISHPQMQSIQIGRTLACPQATCTQAFAPLFTLNPQTPGVVYPWDITLSMQQNAGQENVTIEIPAHTSEIASQFQGGQTMAGHPTRRSVNVHGRTQQNPVQVSVTARGTFAIGIGVDGPDMLVRPLPNTTLQYQASCFVGTTPRTPLPGTITAQNSWSGRRELPASLFASHIKPEHRAEFMAQATRVRRQNSDGGSTEDQALHAKPEGSPAR